MPLTCKSMQPVLFGIIISVFACSGIGRGPSAPEPSCGPELTLDQVSHIAKEAIRAMGDDPSRLSTDYTVKIRTEGCEYVFSAIPIPRITGGQIVMRIDREGRVKSVPWCCPLGQCPDLCSGELWQKPAVEQP